MQANFGFLYANVRDEFPFWELTGLVLKFLLAAIPVFANERTLRVKKTSFDTANDFAASRNCGYGSNFRRRLTHRHHHRPSVQEIAAQRAVLHRRRHHLRFRHHQRQRVERRGRVQRSEKTGVAGVPSLSASPPSSAPPPSRITPANSNPANPRTTSTTTTTPRSPTARWTPTRSG